MPGGVLQPEHRYGVKELIGLLGWPTKGKGPWYYYLLVALARRLDGWRWPVGEGRYPAEAAPCVLRALDCMHGLEPHQPFTQNLLQRIGFRR